MSLRSLCGIACLLFSLAFTSPLHAAMDEPDESKAEFLVVPALLHQVNGKYPNSHVVLFYRGCGKDSSGTSQHALQQDLAYTVQFSGSGVTANGLQRDDDCTLSFDLANTSTQPGTTVADIYANKRKIGSAFLHFMDPLAGPVPGPPLVDVLWAPISKGVCDKAFGRTVAKRFFCIALKVGNNSGYQLQIAGVGFDVPFGKAGSLFNVKTPNTSYALTRAVAQNEDSGRSYVVHSIEGLGLLMTSAAPYFHNVNSSARFGLATSIVSNPLEAAFNLIVPDHSVRQSNNLDDQALRDGKLIPNNTQVTLVVFLDKGSVTLDYKRACDTLFSGYDVLANAPYLASTAAASSGTIGIQAQSSRNETAQSGKLVQENTFPFSTRRENYTFLRNRQTKVVADQYNDCVQGRTSSGIKQALGQLVLVGDEIQYLQRIVVDQTVHSQETAAGAQPDDQPKLAQLTLSITGHNLDKLPASLSVMDSGTIQIATRDATSTAEAATYTLPNKFDPGTNFTVQASGNALPRELHGTVTPPVPSVTAATLSADTLTLTGTDLDQMPKTILICKDGTAKCQGTRASTPTSTSASYTLAKDRANPATVSLETQPGFTLKTSPLTATAASTGP